MQKNNKERLAVCFYGLPRGNLKIWKNIIANLSANYQPEYFVHTWILEKPSVSWHGIDKFEEKNIHDFLMVLTQTKSLKSFNVELQRKHFPETLVSSSGATIFYSNQKNMLLSMSKSLLGLEKYLETGDYDYQKIILIRTDLILKNPLIFDQCIQSGIHHCGHQTNNRLDCEDLILFIKEVNINNIINWPRIYSPTIFEDQIYNLIPHFCTSQNIEFKFSGYEYGRDYSLYRKTSFIEKLRRYLTRAINLTRKFAGFH